MCLNEWTEQDQQNRPPLPPTDARFRPDIRKMEEGNIDLAGQEKNRLEEKQRATRQLMEKRREEWQPRSMTKLFQSSIMIERLSSLSDGFDWLNMTSLDKKFGFQMINIGSAVGPIVLIFINIF